MFSDMTQWFEPSKENVLKVSSFESYYFNVNIKICDFECMKAITIVHAASITQSPKEIVESMQELRAETFKY